MPFVTTDQGLTLPLQADASNEQTAMTAYNAGAELRLVHFYTNAADRTARNPTPVAGEISYLATPGNWWVCQTGGVTPVWWEMRPLFVRKPTQTQTVNNSTTLVTDDALFLPVEANARYTFQAEIWWIAGTTGDIKFAWTGPAGFLMPRWQIRGFNTIIVYSVANAVSAGTALTAGGQGAGVLNVGLLTGVFTTAATPGTVSLQWAQNTLEVINTVVQTDSWITFTRVG